MLSTMFALAGCISVCLTALPLNALCQLTTGRRR